MRNLDGLNRYRQPETEVRLYGIVGDSGNGVFRLENGLLCVASSSEGWDHVSVSQKGRCPTWEEMSRAHQLFFADDEVAIQYNLPPSKNINFHKYCLHLWRPHGVVVPMPPTFMV